MLKRFYKAVEANKLPDKLDTQYPVFICGRKSLLAKEQRVWASEPYLRSDLSVLRS